MIIKTVLVATNHLVAVGGSETFTYTLIESLVDKGYHVEYFTFFKGLVSNKIEKELGVKYKSLSKYDLILANHNSCVKFLSRYGLLIQTCHGIFPKLEQPNKYADGYVSISNEVHDHLNFKGFTSIVILNGINCDRFKPMNALNKKLKNVLSLSQSDLANDKIEAACKSLNIGFSKLNKHINPVWDVENNINKADLVVGLGRSVYESMACGRAILVFDDRGYFESYGDGYLTKKVLDLSLYHNLSGRTSKLKFNTEDIKHELLKFDVAEGELMREFAVKKLNMHIQSVKYIEYAYTLKKKTNFITLLLVCWTQKLFPCSENRERLKSVKRRNK